VNATHGRFLWGKSLAPKRADVKSIEDGNSSQGWGALDEPVRSGLRESSTYVGKSYFRKHLPVAVCSWSLVMYSGVRAVATVSVDLGRLWLGTKDQTLMAKAARLKILYGEGDVEEQKATAEALDKAGHTVEKAIGRKGVEAALAKSKFDLMVLGPSLSRNDRHHLPYMAKKAQAEISVLVMHADGSRHPYVDASTDTGASVENVLARIEGMAIAGMIPAVAGATAGS
jgi:hypothetical protein